MLYHIVSGSSKLGQFRWSGFFFLSTNRNLFQRNLFSRTETAEISLLSLPNRIFWNYFSRATFPQCYIILCQDRQNWVSSDGLDFFPINKSELISTESTLCNHFWTETKIVSSISPKSNLLELFSRATFPQCYIILCQDRQNWVSSDGLDFFLYTNRNCFQMNQQPASTTGSEPLRYSFYLFQIDSSESFLTSHISTMLVSGSSKLGQFQWSGFFPYQHNRNYLHRNKLWASTSGPKPFR